MNRANRSVSVKERIMVRVAPIFWRQNIIISIVVVSAILSYLLATAYELPAVTTFVIIICVSLYLVTKKFHSGYFDGSVLYKKKAVCRNHRVYPFYINNRT